MNILYHIKYYYFYIFSHAPYKFTTQTIIFHQSSRFHRCQYHNIIGRSLNIFCNSTTFFIWIYIYIYVGFSFLDILYVLTCLTLDHLECVSFFFFLRCVFKLQSHARLDYHFYFPYSAMSIYNTPITNQPHHHQFDQYELAPLCQLRRASHHPLVYVLVITSVKSSR